MTLQCLSKEALGGAGITSSLYEDVDHITVLIDGSVAFTYLSFAHIPERPDEAEVLEPHTINAHYITAMLFFVVFGDSVVRRIEGSETSYWFWLFSGKGETIAVFSSLSVLALFLHWIKLGRALKATS